MTRLLALATLAALACLPARAAKVAPGKTGSKSSRRAGAIVEPGAARWMKSMTLREKAAQLIVIRSADTLCTRRSHEYRKFMRLVEQEHVGGLILINIANGRISSRADPMGWPDF